MEIDPIETADDAERSHSRLNTRVAITVALLATFMGICKVKDDNIVQAMQQAQADKIDNWSFYQARNIRQEIAQAELTNLRLQTPGGAARVQLDSAIARYDALVRDQAAKKDSLRLQAVENQKSYDSLNYRDDQFDLSDTLIALAISLLALTSLVKKDWLYLVALVPTALGVLMGLAGLMGWHVHPDSITSMLS